MKTVAQLGYLALEVSDLESWEKFSTQTMGLEVVNRQENGAFGLRMDSHQQRFFITRGEADDLLATGWEVQNADCLEEVVQRLQAAGSEVARCTPQEAKERMVTGLIKFVDPAGNPGELYYGPEKAESAFCSPLVAHGFVAEELGLGHVVLNANDPALSRAFYENVLGFKFSDRIACEFFGFDVDILFFHANRRHHSLALGKQPKKRIHHFMLEVKSMDDVGLTYDRCIRGGVPIMNTLGRHPNDRMFSFYALTPSGFQFEFGWGGREIDDSTWEPTTYDCISEWGHHPPMMLNPKSRASKKPIKD